MNHILLKNLLLQESPQIGGVYLSDEAAGELQKYLNVRINTDEIFRRVNTIDLGDDFFFVKGLAGGMYDHWIALFKKADAGNVLCFASGLKQVNWNIDGLPTFRVRFSKRFKSFPERAAATAYLANASTFQSGIVITSDTSMSEEGTWIWKELLTRPALDVFVWNLKEQRRENALDWKDVFGNADKFADLVVALKTSPQK